MCRGGKKTVGGFPFQCFVVRNALAWLQLSRTWVGRNVQRSWSSAPCGERGHCGRSNLSPTRVRLLSMGVRKAGQESCSGLCGISFPRRSCSPDTCVCIRLRTLPPLLLGWLGWVRPLHLSLLWLLTGSKGAFRHPGSHSSPSYSEVIHLPFLFYLPRFAASGFFCLVAFSLM